MIKLHTPAQWFSLFNNPTIIIEDDGMIYSEEDYYKTFRNAIGKIDYAEGYIYGSDYHKWPRYPIGQIRQDGDITRIYGSDYHRLGAQPIYYIRDRKVYTDDEFFKLFPNPTYYVENNGSAGRAASAAPPSGTLSSGTVSSDISSDADEDKITIFTLIKWALIALAMIAISFALWKVVYVDDSDFKSQFLANIICALIGGIYAFFKMTLKEVGEWKLSLLIPASIWYVFKVSFWLFWAYMVYGLFLDLGLCLGLVGMALLGLLLSALLNLASSVVVGLLVGILKKIVKR